MSNTTNKPETATQPEQLAGTQYSREDGALLVRQYMSCDTLAEVFWADQLNFAFAKGLKTGGDLTAKLWSLIGEWNSRKSDIRNEGAAIELEAAICDLEDLLQQSTNPATANLIPASLPHLQ